MKDGTKNEAKGALHEAKGAVKEAAGKLTNDHKLEAEGTVEKYAGKAQKEVGHIENKVEKHLK
jgi:uncharacterized protein YjbJ (UPF0337 family)